MSRRYVTLGKSNKTLTRRIKSLEKRLRVYQKMIEKTHGNVRVLGVKRIGNQYFRCYGVLQ